MLNYYKVSRVLVASSVFYRLKDRQGEYPAEGWRILIQWGGATPSQEIVYILYITRIFAYILFKKWWVSSNDQDGRMGRVLDWPGGFMAWWCWFNAS